MPRKNNTRQSRKNPRQRKALVKEIRKVVKKQLDDSIEDKYTIDNDFIGHSGNFDALTKSLAVNVSPHIVNGDEFDQRTGNRVRLKYLRTFFRYLPQKKYVSHTTATDPSANYVANWIPDLPDATVYLVKINSKMVQNMTATQLRAALMSKFRMAGKCWQDYAQDSGREAVSAIQLMDKFKMKAKYRVIQNSIQPVDQYGSVSLPTTLMDGTITLDEVNPQKTQITSVPQFSYHNLYCDKVAQKVEIDDAFDTPIKYQYWYFVQFGSGYNDDTWDPINAPTQFDIRNVWVFEDA